MASALMKDPMSGLILPKQFVDEKQALKKVMDEIVDNAVYANQHLRGTYYLSLHMRFDNFNPNEFKVSEPVVTRKLPPFVSNQFVFWVNNEKSICELLWMVPPKKKGQKLKVEFNTSGVAYLQAKGAMPS